MFDDPSIEPVFQGSRWGQTNFYKAYTTFQLKTLKIRVDHCSVSFRLGIYSIEKWRLKLRVVAVVVVVVVLHIHCVNKGMVITL